MQKDGASPAPRSHKSGKVPKRESCQQKRRWHTFASKAGRVPPKSIVQGKRFWRRAVRWKWAFPACDTRSTACVQMDAMSSCQTLKYPQTGAHAKCNHSETRSPLPHTQEQIHACPGNFRFLLSQEAQSPLCWARATCAAFLGGLESGHPASGLLQDVALPCL